MPNKYQQVEKFRITPEMNSWLREYKKMNKIRDVIKGGQMLAQQDATAIQKLTRQYEQGMQMLFQAMPKTQVSEIEDVR